MNIRGYKEWWERVENIICTDRIFRQVCDDYTKVALLFLSPLTPHRTFHFNTFWSPLADRELQDTGDIHLMKFEGKKFKTHS